MKTVFLAEDSNIQAMIYKRALQRLPGLEVQHFEDGLEVYLAAFRNPPDLLILDIMLPTLSGVAALRLLKFDREMSKVPVLILSALTEDDIEFKVRDMRADGYLPKPIKPEQLIAEVERILGVFI